MSTAIIQAYNLKQACEFVSEDGFLSESEIWRLADWLEHHPETWRTEIGKRLIRSINAAICDGKLEPGEIQHIASVVVEIRDAHPSVFVSEEKAAPTVNKRDGFLSGARTWLAQQRANSQWNNTQEAEAKADKQLARKAKIARIVQRLKDGHYSLCENFIPQRGEQVCYVTSGRLQEMQVVKREYVGGSRSTRIRVAKGVSFSVGGSRGELVKHEELVETARGQLVITTKRLVFLGQEKSINIDMSKLLSAQIAPNGMQFPAPRTGKPCVIRFDREDGDFVVAVMNFALGEGRS